MSDATYDNTSAPATNGGTMKDAMVNTSEVPPMRRSKLNVSDAAAAVNAVQNHPITQNVANGPVATSVKNQANATGNEFSGLASSRQTPSYTAANDTKLTHYHSFFYTLLSWQHPRATALSFAASVAFIFACRYLPILRYTFKITYMTLGVVALAEVAGKLVTGSGLASSVRPRKYYAIQKETLEASLDDLEQLINFFVIEVQRILFAESVPATIAAFLAAFLSYYLIKILPFWGMSLLTTCVVFLAPLVYTQNQEFIDEHITHAHKVISAQATQVKDLTAEHTSKGFEAVKGYTGDYASKASELVGGARQRIPLPSTTKTEPAGQSTTFPTAPSSDPFPTAPNSDLPSTEGEPIAASST